MSQREIEFRAWDKIKKCMIRDDFLENNIWYMETKECDEIYEVMQYTGRKDKNGKKIWQGDICICEWGDGEKTKMEVYWDKYEAAFRLKRKDYFSLLSHSRIIVEVIGDIHTNPKLLKEPVKV